jgi:hypothetical protein
MGFEQRTGPRAGRMLILVGAVLAVWLSGSATLAQEAGLAPWNQEAVTKAAVDLHTNVRALRNGFERLTPPMMGSGQRTAFYKLRDDLRVFERVSFGLSESLSKGEGHEETLNRFRRLETTRRDILVQARRTDVPNDVLNLTEPVRGSLQELRPFYVATPMPEDVIPDLEKGDEGKM